jgi:hypothetical protein
MNFLRFSIVKKLIKLGHEIKKFQTGEPSLLTRRSYEYGSNTIWMGQIGVKMNILWLKENQLQFCKY